MRNQIRVLERPDGERTAVSGAGRWLVLAVTAAAQFMVILDVSVVNVALPAIKDDLHFSQEGLQWVITAYAILFGGVLLLGGRLADLLGRRRVFMTGSGCSRSPPCCPGSPRRRGS
jgi:MFS family permease